MRKHIDWKDCMVLELDGLADPHSWIPYSQDGQIIDLYIKILFVRDNLNFKRGLRRCNLELTDFRFCFRCALHVKCLLNVKPKYFTSFSGDMILLLNITKGQSKLCNEKFTCMDLVSLV